MKILYISDDPRMPSGYGRIGFAVCKYLREKGHQVVIMGGVSHPGPFQPLAWEGVTIWPVQGYGNMEQLRYLLRREKPDVTLINADPRFFVDNAFKIDNEIRRICPLVFYHLWDDTPFPVFNVPLYRCCDGIITATKFTFDMLQSRAEEFALPPVHYAPIGFDLNVYRPLADEEKAKFRTDFFKSVQGNKPYDENKIKFIVGFIGRFGHRKRIPDIISAFKKFAEGKDDVLLIVHSTIQDEGGNLLYLHQQLFSGIPLIISSMGGQPDPVINHLYNLFSVSVNLSDAEGFGMPLAESMAAGTPVIAAKNSGPMGFVNDANGWLLEPSITSLVGSGIVPYINERIVSEDAMVVALQEAYSNPTLRAKKAANCRGTIMRDYNVVDMTQNIERILIETKEKWQPYPNYTVSSFPE